MGVIMYTYMSYLEWIIEKVSGVLPFFFFCGLWFCGNFFFLLWTHQQRLKGIFPLPLSEEAASLCVSVFPALKGHVLCFRIKPSCGSSGSQVGGGWEWGPWGVSFMPGWGCLVLWLVVPKERRSRRAQEVQGPGVGDGCRDVVKAGPQASQLGSSCHAVRPGEERVQLQGLPVARGPCTLGQGASSQWPNGFMTETSLPVLLDWVSPEGLVQLRERQGRARTPCPK